MPRVLGSSSREISSSATGAGGIHLSAASSGVGFKGGSRGIFGASGFTQLVAVVGQERTNPQPLLLAAGKRLKSSCLGPRHWSIVLQAKQPRPVLPRKC